MVIERDNFLLNATFSRSIVPIKKYYCLKNVLIGTTWQKTKLFCIYFLSIIIFQFCFYISHSNLTETNKGGDDPLIGTNKNYFKYSLYFLLWPDRRQSREWRSVDWYRTILPAPTDPILQLTDFDFLLSAYLRRWRLRKPFFFTTHPSTDFLTRLFHCTYHLYLLTTLSFQFSHF